jgi:hypothetical protein
MASRKIRNVPAQHSGRILIKLRRKNASRWLPAVIAMTNPLMTKKISTSKYKKGLQLGNANLVCA